MYQPYYTNANMPISIGPGPIIPTNLMLNQPDTRQELQMLINDPTNSNIRKYYNEIIEINIKETGSKIIDINNIFSLDLIISATNEKNKYKLLYNWLLLCDNNEVRTFNMQPNQFNSTQRIKINLQQYVGNSNKRYFILSGLLIIFNIFNSKNIETASRFYNDYTEGDNPLTNDMIVCINEIKNKNVNILNNGDIENSINSLIGLLNDCYEKINNSNKNSENTGFFSFMSGGKKGKYKNKTNKKIKGRKYKTNRKNKTNRINKKITRKNKKITRKNKRKN